MMLSIMMTFWAWVKYPKAKSEVIGCLGMSGLGKHLETYNKIVFCNSIS